MSTRASIHFCYHNEKKPVAIIYRHSDGYPEGLGADLERFINYLKKNVKDNRFSDPSYLAAKWVVWDALQMDSKGKATATLDFLGVGICMEDAGDIEYIYKVICADGQIPVVECKHV